MLNLYLIIGRLNIILQEPLQKKVNFKCPKYTLSVKSNLFLIKSTL